MVSPAGAVELDPDFERDFAQLMADHQGGGSGGVGSGVGRQALAAAAPPSAQLQQAAEQQRDAAEAEVVSFRVVMRRSGREDRTRELHIPLSAGMAAHLRQKEEAEAAEKAELKRLVLEANSRDQQVRRGMVVVLLRMGCCCCCCSRAQQSHTLLTALCLRLPLCCGVDGAYRCCRSSWMR